MILKKPHYERLKEMTQTDLLRYCTNAYNRYHKIELLSPDPLEVLREQAPEDQEISAFLIASLSLGRVNGIVSICRNLIEKLGGDGGITRTILSHDYSELKNSLKDLRWRFFDGHHLATYCYSLACIIRMFGSIEKCFEQGLEVSSPLKIKNVPIMSYYDSPVIRGLTFLRKELFSCTPELHPMLFPNPYGTGAQKRLHMCLRWLIRRDDIDIGLWKTLAPSDLWPPIDTHILRHCIRLGITRKPVADVKTLVQVHAAFQSVCPQDPCKFDFALSRMGINPVAASEESEFYRNLES